MKYFVGIILAFIAYGSSAETQGPPSAPTADEVYSTSLSAPVIASRCSQVFPEYKNHFEPAFADWRNRNLSVIDSGREEKKAKLEPNETMETEEGRLAIFLSIALDSFQDAHLRNRCDLLLEEVGAPESSGGA